MTHPYLRVVVEAAEERTLLVDGGKILSAILATSCWLYISAVVVGNELCTIADAEHRKATQELCEIDLESFGIVHAVGAAGKNHSDDFFVILWKLVVWQNLTERVEFAQTASDELCRLTSEVEDNDFLLLTVLFIIV